MNNIEPLKNLAACRYCKRETRNVVGDAFVVRYEQISTFLFNIFLQKSLTNSGIIG